MSVAALSFSANISRPRCVHINTARNEKPALTEAEQGFTLQLGGVEIMDRFVEFQVRKVIAEHLGVDPGEVGPEVSLRDDLAADSLDLVEMVSALEDRLGVLVPDRVVERARTCGDLVDALAALLRSQSGQPEGHTQHALWAWAALRQGGASEPGQVVCADRLTPYTSEVIAEAALRAGKMASLELTLPSDATDAEMAEAEDRFGWLRNHEVSVAIRREGDRSLGDFRVSAGRR